MYLLKKSKKGWFFDTFFCHFVFKFFKFFYFSNFLYFKKTFFKYIF